MRSFAYYLRTCFIYVRINGKFSLHRVQFSQIVEGMCKNTRAIQHYSFIIAKNVLLSFRPFHEVMYDSTYKLVCPRYTKNLKGENRIL